ncbi:MAG TPA: DUF2279 domain-containing protein [Cytophagaceae bacterium]|jgi:uncharacterized protein YfiM (DUF2279 family)|nr:DUF2279 domain-containing protein [Cytophagaceae bacterium]
MIYKCLSYFFVFSFLVSVCCLTPRTEAQSLVSNDTLKSNSRHKLLYVSVAGGVAYGITLYELNRLWYSQSPRSSFHFFNDNNEWNQMDKMGHFYTSFYLSTGGVDLLMWGGLSQKKALILDNILGLALLTPVEIMDGYSSAYGASWGDEVADAAGDVFAYSQYLLWKGIRIYPRFSDHPTSYSSIRPNVLGSTFVEQIIKDYNGQTYWLSTPIADWIKNKESKFPKWLGVSLGYGSSGMVYADPRENSMHGYDSYRRYFISMDIYLSRIKTKSKFLNTFFYLTNMIHFPLPALEFNTHQGLVFHPAYF